MGRVVRTILQERHAIALLAVPVVLCLLSFQLSGGHDPEPYELNYPSNFGRRFNIPEDNPLTKEGVRLGRYLFYEKALSGNGQISCGTCHQQKFAFSDGMPFSSGVDGSFTRRNAMSLVNLLWTRNFFWDGRAASLEEQAIFPLTNPHEMGQALEVSVAKLNALPLYPPLFEDAFGTSEITAEKIVKAIAQFERTIISADTKYDQYLAGAYQPTESELRGMKLFMTAPSPKDRIRGANCAHCHGSPKLVKELFHSNGLDSDPVDVGRMEVTGLEVDRGRFRVPTLRNVALTAPYMHDGRLATLADVLDHYSEHVAPGPNVSSFLIETRNDDGKSGLRLTEDEKTDILTFLMLFTDSTLVTRSEFSDPHPRD